MIGNSSGRLGPKVDVRGRGGYIVAPPSLHPSGVRYAWTLAPFDMMPAPLPPAIRAALLPPPPAPAVPATRSLAEWGQPAGDARARLRAWLRCLPTGLRDGGGRNELAYRIAARCLADLSPTDTLDTLRAWNATNADPLPAARLEQAVRNATRYRRGVA